MHFTKMHGAGNDYVYVNCFEENLPKDPGSLAVAVSDRHFGIGSDGLILIMPSDQADAKMQMYNADGSESEMCGNGIRCVAKYLVDHGICDQPSLRIETGAGILALDVFQQNGKVHQVRVDMGPPKLAPEDIPIRLPGEAVEQVIDIPLQLEEHSLTATCVSMGNPHCVIFVDTLSDELVLELGPRIEKDPRFPSRVNVEFVQVRSRSEVHQRTWERGSGETLACGTGASAVCVAGVISGRTNRELTNHLRGGTLFLEWSQETNHVFMTGPATEVYSGHWPN
ncbi:MAG: diaminopimelate epimerase [Planctomycetota bacterium]|nr:diaminopimelate epimerase [Planctomycetota bacterium]